jgi:hypothetical protein
LVGDLSVHCIRGEIDLAGPSDRAVIDEDLLKKLRVQQGRERTGQLFWLQLHVPI